MNIQTLNQTIKTLEGVRNAVGSFTRADVDLTLGLLRREVEALAEKPAPVQEPVANETKSILLRMAMALEVVSNDWRISDPALRIDIANMLATPPAAQPAKRTAVVPLTDEEIEDIHCTPPRERPRGKFPFARMIEAKLKEKNA